MRYKLFTALFLLLCLLPIVGIPLFGTAQPAANETLTAVPSLTNADGSANLNVLEDVSDYVGDHFALRQEMITAWRTLVAAVFGESDEPDVILGKENWLFYAETLDDYEGVNTMTDRQIYAAARSLALMQEACADMGVEFLFTVAPNKNSLYGQYMPDRYPAATEPGNLARLTSALEAQGVAYLDLYNLLSQESEVLYRRYDSHWNNLGAALAADAILSALDIGAEPFYGGEYTVVEAEPGDLYQMLYPTGTDTDTDMAFTRPFTYTYRTPIRSAEDNRIVTDCAGAAGGSLLMFRDSFGNALHPFLAEGFQSAVFSRVTPYDLTMVESAEADTVVIELVERNLDWLITRPAVFAAPERTLDETPAVSDAIAVTAAVTESGPDGCVTLSGTFAVEGLDDDSPIYLRLGNVLYEATPAGNGNNPFTACIPQTAFLTSMTLLLRVNGQWVESLPVSLS